MSKELISEVDKMKNFFEYKRGLVISEQNYNLIVEQTDEEILTYSDKYIDTHSCDEIADDMNKIKNTDTYTNLSKEDQGTFNDAITGLKNPGMACTLKGITYNPLKKGSACNSLKGYMKKQFREQLPIKRDMIVSQICAFSYIWTEEPPLNGCKKTKSDNTGTNNSTENGSQTTTTQQPQDNAQTTTTTQQTQDNVQTTTTQQQDNTQTTTNQNVDYKLDTAEKIKEFQNWMDKNYGKWAYSSKYKRNYSVDQNTKKGWGSMGPNTTKAWGDKEKKEKYLKEKGLSVPQKQKQDNTTKNNVEPGSDDEVLKF